MLAGFTKSGKPRSSAIERNAASLMWDSRSVRNSGCWMPFAASTCLATPLSIDTALPSTPVPTYGMLASSSTPWMVPSSPSGPWRRGNTTVRSSLRTCATIGVIDVGSPMASRRSGTWVGPFASAAIASVASIHAPLRVMPTAVTRYLSASSARNTCAAVTQLTSCSADSPPNNTMTWVRVGA